MDDFFGVLMCFFVIVLMCLVTIFLGLVVARLYIVWFVL